MDKPRLTIVVPCYNEEEVLPITAPQFLEKINELINAEQIAPDSSILFVNDGSKDNTWNVIETLSKENPHYNGISLSCNRGHQNALLAGLMEAKEYADITISIDCDGQDDLDAMNQMVEEYHKGAEIVYGVRNNRETDSFFKRHSAQSFYKLMRKMGVNTVYNHADYRLVSSRVLKEFANFEEVNIFLRGMFPLVGFKSTCVYYARKKRVAGKSHYPFHKMMALAIDGITSLSIRPIRLITILGFFFSFVSFLLMVFAFGSYFWGTTVPGWSSSLTIMCFFGGIQLISLGVIGEYIGKIYLEVKKRPKYIISEKTYEDESAK